MNHDFASGFHLKSTIEKIKHHLPAQAPLKDFIHHNTLHAFQKMKFFEGTRHASEILGYKVSLKLSEYRELFGQGRIREEVLEQRIQLRHGRAQMQEWKQRLLSKHYEKGPLPRIGSLRANWKKVHKIDLDSLVHPTLFRILCSYLDQGISIWNFPVWHKGFLDSIREMEQRSFTSFFRSRRARKLLTDPSLKIEDLLAIVVGDESLYETYLFDQQFAHQGWSGMVSVIEDFPQTLLDTRQATLHDLIVFELLLEIDSLDYVLGDRWQPLANALPSKPGWLFANVDQTELHEALELWQEAFEWSYYDQVLAGISTQKTDQLTSRIPSFQSLFCIDDRECSLRRYLEKFDPACATFGTPGFFGVEFFFQPNDGKFLTKLCPAPVTPKFLIREGGAKADKTKDLHFTKETHSLFRGWLISQTLGFWSALKLFINIFKPTMGPATASSFRHMNKAAHLSVVNQHLEKENGLQVGYTIDEMTNRVEALLKSIGLISDFAPLVYVVGHGSSSVNNPHFAAYDCGACSGRPGSVNARVVCIMANHPEVRTLLQNRGIVIPESTRFVGALHDTTRDDIEFFDEIHLSAEQLRLHVANIDTFNKALNANAKERSRRFESIDTHLTGQQVHEQVRVRSVSLFEPRPELNHATNALCIVGRRSMTRGLFLDRRSFLNSFDYQVDPDGKYLFNILKAAAPVCGGINLEYFFSRVDNQKLGAGTKLPHNVMGLFGVANGIDGDLRPGLPSQMIEVHDPVRLLIIVEHFPAVVLQTIQRSPETYEWFANEWVNLVAVDPKTRACYSFKDGQFHPYEPLARELPRIDNLDQLLETNAENFPVYVIN
ncbi:MAG: YbcC family protein [Cyclobacteriaceae bacterium]